MDGSCRFIPGNSVTHNDSRGYLARNMNQDRTSTRIRLRYSLCTRSEHYAPTPIAELNPPTTDPGIPMAQWLNTQRQTNRQFSRVTIPTDGKQSRIFPNRFLCRSAIDMPLKCIICLSAPWILSLKYCSPKHASVRKLVNLIKYPGCDMCASWRKPL